MNTALTKYLQPTAILNFEHPTVIDFLDRAAADAGREPVSTAVALYYAVREGIRYDPYSPFYLPAHYRASAVIQRGKGYCVGKAALLCALGRACSIPSRLGFATVRNHLASRQLIDYLGSDRFVFHGYVEFYLEGRWVKATPAFNAQLCERHRVDPLEFNGREDAVFQAYNRENNRYMEYLEDLGIFDDVPVRQIVAAWENEYGADRVQGWISGFESAQGELGKDFYEEKPLDQA
ncbi:MAG: transglutaminase [Deltaproteobacteria bacterium SG8_13]|nr:MAG: transglutaminase [Deltaproteobacteria bacterium SG8_13]